MRFDVAASAPSAAASHFRGSCCDLDRAQDDARCLGLQALDSAVALALAVPDHSKAESLELATGRLVGHPDESPRHAPRRRDRRRREGLVSALTGLVNIGSKYTTSAEPVGIARSSSAASPSRT